MSMFSELCQHVLQNEKMIKNQYNFQYTCPESILYAILSCFSKENSLPSFDDEYPIPFEKERVLLILKKILKSSINISMRVLTRTLKSINMPNDYKIISNEIITCDVLLLRCILDLNANNKMILKKEYHDFDIEHVLNEINHEIYPYVIEQATIQKDQLDKKIKKAIYYRDFKPAEKLMEESFLQHMLNQHVEMKLDENILKLTIPYFFKDSNQPLVLSIIKNGDMYYVHDYGLSIKELNKRVTSKNRCTELVKSFISGTICYLHDDIVIGEVNSLPHLSRYLQRLVMIANLDLIEGLFPVFEDYERKAVYPFVGEGCLNEVVNYFNSYFNVTYDNQKGLLIGSHLCYFGNSTTASFKVELKDDIVIVKDHYNSFKEGAIFENVWYNIDDLTPYQKYINKVAERFNGMFDGKDVSLSFNKNEEFIKSFMNFVQMAILLAPMNDYFELEKIKNQ